MANLRVNKITGTEVFETTGSVQFDGSGDYLLKSYDTSYDFGAEDFTVEAFVLTTDTTTNYPSIVGRWQSAGNACWDFRPQTTDASDNFSFVYSTNGTTPVIVNSGENICDGKWHHIVASRNGAELYLFVDGILKKTHIIGTSVIFDSVSAPLYIGYDPYGSSYYRGHTSNLRILKGKALYTENFTPPTRELTVTPETVLLACQSTTNAALEKTGKTITVNGNAVANELTPGLLTDVVKSGGSSAITGSVEFDGTGDYLSLVDSDDWYLNEDFTLECWFFPTSTPSNSNYGTLVGQWESGGGSDRNVLIYYYTDGSGNSILYSNLQTSTTQLTGNFPIDNASSFNNSWHHTALVVNNNQYIFFVDGIKVSTSTVTGTVNNSTVKWMIGASDNGSGVGEFIFDGFISNVRLVKGTALYTSDFIPPTRELKNIPGTVLLCCQDSNDPTTEATGKTITPYGSLDRTDLGVELVVNGTFDTDTTGWTEYLSTNTWSSGQMQITRTGGGGQSTYQTFTTVPGKVYRASAFINSSGSRGDLYIFDGVAWSGTTITSIFGPTTGNSGVVNLQFVALSTTTSLAFAIDGIGTSIFVDNVSVIKLDPGTKPAFTPPVGFDGSVTFEGTTKINTENYFYLPTGNTEKRDSGAGVRGVIMGGYTAPENSIIDYINIATTGNAITFGTLTTGESSGRKASSTTRGLCAGTNGIQYITIPSTGNSQDFGNLNAPGGSSDSGCSSSTRGIFAGGLSLGPTTWHNNIDYVTIASTGDAVDFGDLSTTKTNLAGLSSPTRGIFAGGYDPKINTIDYITIASTGNAQDFGDLINVRFRNAGCSSSVRGITGGGQNPGYTNSIEYITISSTGTAQDFGDLSQVREFLNATSSQIRGIFSGGSPGPTYDGVNTIDYVTIQSTGNATDFGDLTVARGRSAVVSNGHGGLG